jgi:hypothetical protein
MVHTSGRIIGSTSDDHTRQSQIPICVRRLRKLDDQDCSSRASTGDNDRRVRTLQFSARDPGSSSSSCQAGPKRSVRVLAVAIHSCTNEARASDVKDATRSGRNSSACALAAAACVELESAPHNVIGCRQPNGHRHDIEMVLFAVVALAVAAYREAVALALAGSADSLEWLGSSSDGDRSGY